MEIKNPISEKVRGWLYVAAIVFGAVATVATVVLTVLGLTPWIAVLSAASGAVLTLASTLARANLSVPAGDSVVEEPDTLMEG